ncbi:MAG: flagellar hook-length control protein FliK, partial [Phycisphaerae bacterium]
VAGVSVGAAAGATTGPAVQQGEAGPVGPEGPAAGRTMPVQATELSRGASVDQAPAGTVVAGGPRRGGLDGAEPRSPAADPAGAAAKQTASGQGSVLPVHLYRQAGDGQAAGRDGNEGTPSGSAAKMVAGNAMQEDGAAGESSSTGASTRSLPDAEPEGWNAAARPAAGPADGESAAKHLLSQAGDGARTAAATAPAEPSGGQTGPATAGVRGGAAGHEAAAAGQRLGDAAQQVAESIRATGGRSGRQLTVHLNPPELGRVRIVLESEGDAVRGTVRVDVPETLAKLQQEAAPLMQRLQAEGIDLRRLDVMLNQDQGGGQAGQDAAFGQGQNDPDAWTPDASGQAFASAENEAAVAAGPESGSPDEAGVASGRTDGSINVQV